MRKFREVSIGRLQTRFRANMTAGSIVQALSWEPGDEQVSGAASSEPTKVESFWRRWLGEYVEIAGSLDRLAQSLAYLRQSPAPVKSRVRRFNEADWIQYHVETYLQEEYNLYCRLIGFLRRLERMANRKRDNGGARSAMDLIKQVNEAFSRVVRVRGEHVHSKRYEEPRLRNLQSHILFSQIISELGFPRNLAKVTESLRILKYRRTRRYWKSQLSDGNKAIERLCNHVFGDVTDFLVRCEPRQ